MDDPDLDFLRRAAAGDARAADALVRRHAARLVRLAARVLGDVGDAEDVAQEAFVRAWRAAPSWQSGRAKFETWLWRVTLNLCFDRLRRRRETPTADAGLLLLDASASASDAWLAEQRAAHVHAALARLPERQRAAIALCYYEDATSIAAAAALEVSVKALESLLSRARRSLRADLAAIAPDLLGEEP